MVSDKDSSKVSKGKENSPEEVEATNAETADQTAVDEAESSDDVLSEATERAEAVEAEAVDAIEDAEIVDDGEEPAVEAADETSREDVSIEAVEETPAEVSGASGPSAFGLVFGGLIAGAIGFLVAAFAVPAGWPNPPVEPSGSMQAEIDSQRDQIEALESLIAGLGEAPAAVAVDLTPVQHEIASLAERVDALNGDLAAASARVEVLETMPVLLAEPAPAVDFDAEMNTFRAELEAAADAARAEVQAAQERAAKIEAAAVATAGLAVKRAAIAEVSAALASGAPFEEALASVPNAPEALAAVAEQGIPTLAALRAEFPDAAREALRGAQSVPDDASATARMAAFLREQTNARSLSPREGGDPDAVLSRAEAALNNGELAAALAELSGLPDGAIASLSGWIVQAETRVAATDAVQLLSNELN